MHWVSHDLAGVTLEVKQAKNGKWLFRATTDRGTLAKSAHGHPMDAMQTAKTFTEAVNAVKKEKTTSTSSTSSRETSSAV
jgi:hypothetical protein